MRRRIDPRPGLSLVLTLSLASLWSPVSEAANGLDRDDEPVVLTGELVPLLQGNRLQRIVGFRWDGAWTQIPIQIDERFVVDFGTIYGMDPIGETVLTYADPDTFTGRDPDDAFDGDDELVFLAGEAGGPAPAQDPSNVDGATRSEIRLTHPVTGAQAFVYLYRATRPIDPSAGAAKIQCSLALESGAYRDTYKTDVGPNPENTWIRTPFYEAHFSDRWIRDGMVVVAPGASRVDVLDRHKFLFAPRQCGRSENTFSAGEGAFIVHRSGPVRGLRGYVGANSGPTTYRVHAFYPEREVILTGLRVHEIPGVMDFLDFSDGAVGMVWRNAVERGGVTIDGVPDQVSMEWSPWSVIEGSQGTIASTYRIDTNIPELKPETYWSDDSRPAEPTCTGDGVEFGANGTWLQQSIPDTSASNPDGNRFEAIRVVGYGSPDAGVDLAEALFESVQRPLIVGVGDAVACIDGDADGFVVCVGGCTPVDGAVCGDCNDADASIHPSADEVCNGLDDDCDLGVDEDLPSITWWRDGDGDGYGQTSDTLVTCEGAPGPGWADNSTDCDDTNDAIHPGAVEVCNGLDDDCDVTVDDGLPTSTWWRDADGDGYGSEVDRLDTCDPAPGPDWVDNAEDCDDGESSIWPGAPEWCDGSDRDCSGTVDDPPCVDYDLDGSGRVDGIELARIGRAFGTCSDDPASPHPADFDRDGCVDGDDLSVLGNLWATSCATTVLECF